MDRVTMWGFGGGVRTFQAHHGSKMCSYMHFPMHMASLGMRFPEERSQCQLFSSVTCSHSQVPAHTGTKISSTSVPITPCDVFRCTFTPFLGCTFAQLQTLLWACSALWVAKDPGVA